MAMDPTENLKMLKDTTDKTWVPGEKLAIDHVEWFLRTLRPLLIEQFIHGYKHGQDDIRKHTERCK